jgi:hypothetical protein
MSDLDVELTTRIGLGEQFVEQMFTLTSSFRCGLFYKYERYDFGHTLMHYLSRT